jgi:hypothetical protein
LLVGATGNPLEPFRHGRICSLEINHVAHAKLVIEQATKFGAKVPYRASKDYDYYVLPCDLI